MKLIDLTHPLGDLDTCFPGDPTPRIRSYETLAEAGYNTTRLAIGSHQGTHLDAPFHFFRDGLTVDKIPLDRLYGPATLVDLAPGGTLGKEAIITEKMLEAHSAAFRPGARVIYRTGWDKRFGESSFFQRYPSLTVEAARWIVRRGVGLIGMDTPSPAEDFVEVHKVLLGAGLVIVESLANLDQLPPEFLFIGMPLKLTGRDGSPIRAVAAVNSSDDVNEDEAIEWSRPASLPAGTAAGSPARRPSNRFPTY